MDLFVTTYGCDLEVKEGLFQLTGTEGEKTLSPEHVEAIYIATSCTISTNAIALAVENNIDIILISRRGRNLGRFWHGNYHTTSIIRINQARLAASPDGYAFAAKWIWDKFDRQETMLRKWKLQDGTQEKKLLRIIRRLHENSAISLREAVLASGNPAASIRTCEAHVSKKYFEALNLLLPDGFRFGMRSRQPAKDPFNAMLNYSYAILYGQVESVVRKAGLDPYLGIMHENDYNTKSFTFDFIEPYRPWADFVCVSLCAAGSMQADMFDRQEAACLINDKGKKLLIPAWNDFMHEDIIVGKKKISRLALMQKDAHAFARYLKTYPDTKRMYD